MLRRTNDRNNLKPTRKKYCSFCKEGTIPDYKEIVSLRRLTTDRGKIVARTRSGVCYKHQRQLSNAIKKSRYMALLPFAVSVS